MKPSLNRPRSGAWLVAWLAFMLFLPSAAQAARVIEATAIPFTAFLAKAEFDQRFPGEEVADLSTLEPGWYVIYEHESLSYYFGPVWLRSTAEDYLAELRTTVDEAVAQRPSIQDYRLELSYEPSQPTAPAADPSAEANQPVSPPAPPAPPPSGLWGFIRRIFGF